LPQTLTANPLQWPEAASIAADLSPERLTRFFVAKPDESAYRIHKNIRDMVVFSEQNVTGMIGKTDADLLPEEQAAALTVIKQQVLASGKGTRQNVQCTIAGKSVLFDMTVEPLHDNTCAVVGITCATLGVTGQQGGQRMDAGVNGTLLTENNGGNL